MQNNDNTALGGITMDKHVSLIYSPTNAQGKREVHTVYAKTKEECEVLMEKMIAEIRERIKEEKQQMTKERRSK